MIQISVYKSIVLPCEWY